MLTAALAAVWPAPVAASGEFVTSGLCTTNRVFESGSTELRLDVYNRQTTVTLWGPLMQFGRFPASSNAAVKVTLKNARSASTNAGRGCERLASIDLELEPNGLLTEPQKATIIVQFWLGQAYFGVFALPVSMHPRQPAIAWGLIGALQNCLQRQNGNLAFAGRTHLIVSIPRDLRIEEQCLGSLTIDAALVPNGFIDGSPDSLTWHVERFGLVAGRLDARNSDAASCRRGDCRPQVPLRVDLDWPALAALPHPSSVVVTANVFFAEETNTPPRSAASSSSA